MTISPRGLDVISREYVICRRGDETIQHLFFNCISVGKIWNVCDKWTGIVTTHHNIPKKHFQQFRLPGLTKKKKTICGSVCGFL